MILNLQILFLMIIVNYLLMIGSIVWSVLELFNVKVFNTPMIVADLSFIAFIIIGYFLGKLFKKLSSKYKKELEWHEKM